MKKYDIQPFDISSASKDEWTKFHKYRRQRGSEVFPGDPVEDDAGYEAYVKPWLDEFVVKSYAVSPKEDSSTILAWLQMYVFKETSISYPGNEHVLHVRSLAVLKEHRRNGIGRALLKLVHEFAVEKGKRVIVGGTAEEEGRALNRVVGGTEALEMRDNRLNLEGVDWNMVEEWEREGAKSSPNASLEFYSSIPDELLEAWCKKYSEVMNQAPLDDLDIGDFIYTPKFWKTMEDTAAKAGQTWFAAIIREKNGDISGLSDVLYIPSRSPLLDQQLTGVDQNYRGQGKGKWVKAALLLKVREKFPDIETVRTGNATSNAPMLSINERLGFKLHKEIFNVQIETEKLGEYVSK